MSRGRRVVLIEDEYGVALVVRDVVRDMGYAVEIAATTAAGLALIQAAPTALIICDLMLPGGSGLTLHADLQADAGLRAIPFVLVSAAPTVNDWGLPMPVVSKPFKLATLMALVSALAPLPA